MKLCTWGYNCAHTYMLIHSRTRPRTHTQKLTHKLTHTHTHNHSPQNHPPGSSQAFRCSGLIGHSSGCQMKSNLRVSAVTGSNQACSATSQCIPMRGRDRGMEGRMERWTDGGREYAKCGAHK